MKKSLERKHLLAGYCTKQGKDMWHGLIRSGETFQGILDVRFKESIFLDLFAFPYFHSLYKMSIEKKRNDSDVNWSIAFSTFWAKTPEDWAKTPCIREAVLAGFGCAGLVMAHKVRVYKGHLVHAGSAGILTFGFAFVASLGLCTFERESRQRMIEQAMKESKIKHAEDIKRK